MLLEIHGGPFQMYGPYFSSELQRYAAEGYVTIWSNPRGSTGYGEDFAHAIDRAYPGNDYDDLMSLVDALVARKYVSEERLFVTGGSGGGILTAWIVTKTDRFAAAASIKPVINWMTMALGRPTSPNTCAATGYAPPMDGPGGLPEILADLVCRQRRDADSDDGRRGGFAHAHLGGGAVLYGRSS